MPVEVVNVWNGSVLLAVFLVCFSISCHEKNWALWKRPYENMQLCFVSVIENEAQNNQGLSVMDKMGV